MNEERKQILKMVEEGKLTAEEALKLIEAIEQQEQKVEVIPAQKGKGQLRILVTDLTTGKKKVSVKIPSNLIKFALKWVPKKYLEDYDYHEMVTAVETGQFGTIVDVTDEEHQEKVEIILE